jgi:hypothetical protein
MKIEFTKLIADWVSLEESIDDLRTVKPTRVYTDTDQLKYMRWDFDDSTLFFYVGIQQTHEHEHKYNYELIAFGKVDSIEGEFHLWIDE